MSGKVIKEGYLVKSPPLEKLFAQWKRRYFRLFESGRLDYYENEHDNAHSAKGIINLLDCEDIEALERFPGRNHCMRVVTPQRTYILQCSSATDLRQWYEKITSTRGIALYLGQSTQGTDSPTKDAGTRTTQEIGGRSPVASRGSPSNGTDHKYINLPRNSSSNVLLVPGRPDKPGKPSTMAYSPQPSSRKSYVPGESSNSQTPVTGTRGMRAASNDWDAADGGESSLTWTIRGKSLDDPSVTGRNVSPHMPARHVPSQSHPSGRTSVLIDPDADTYGYIPMKRAEQNVDEAYEQMAEETIKIPVGRAQPPRASPKPDRQSLPPQYHQVPDGYEKWEDHRPNGRIESGLPEGQRPHPPSRTLQHKYPACQPQPPRITPRGLSMKQPSAI